MRHRKYWTRRANLTALALLALAGSAACGSDTPTGPSQDAVFRPATVPFTLSRGSTYRVSFRVNASAWGNAAPPDQLMVAMGSGEYSGNTSSGSGFRVELFNGSQRLGTGSESAACPFESFVASAPGSCLQHLADFATIQSGTIDGRIEMIFQGTDATVRGFAQLFLVRRADSRVIQNGVTITSHEIR